MKKISLLLLITVFALCATHSSVATAEEKWIPSTGEMDYVLGTPATCRYYAKPYCVCYNEMKMGGHKYRYIMVVECKFVKEALEDDNKKLKGDL